MISPASRARASWSPTADWTRRRSGLAPYTGSNPVTASHSLAAGVTFSVSRRPARRAARDSTCRSSICVSSLVDSASKTMTSSSRFRNSGLNAARTAASTASRLAVSSPNAGSAMNCDPRFEVSTRMVFLKSTVRPWPSVRRPHLVEQHHAVGPAADRLGELAALLVAHVARRRADQPGDRVLLAVLAHVDPDHGPLVVKEELGERLGQLGLADAGRPEEQERAGRPVGVGHARPGSPDGVGDGLHGPHLTDHPLAELGLHPEQLGGFPLEQAPGGDAGPGGHDVGHVIRADLLLYHGRRRGGPGRAGSV